MARIPGGRRSTASHAEANESDVSAQEEEEPSLSKSQTKKEKSTRSSSRTSLKRSRTEVLKCGSVPSFLSFDLSFKAPLCKSLDRRLSVYCTVKNRRKLL